MPARRRLLAAASALLSAAALTACERPTPLVTVQSGGEHTYTEANVWCFEEDQVVDDGECAERSEAVTELPVRGGEQVGVDVGEEVVERGWQLELLDPASPESGQTAPVQDDHWFAFTAPSLQPGSRLLLTVRTVTGEGQATGEWQFALVPAED